MANTTKSTSHKHALANGTAHNIADFSAFLSSFTENAAHTSMDTSANWWQAYMGSVTEMNREFMQFVATRLQHDVDVSQSLAQCRDWQAASDLHREWLSKMSEEYMGEAKALMDIAASSAREIGADANDKDNEPATKSAR